MIYQELIIMVCHKLFHLCKESRPHTLKLKKKLYIICCDLTQYILVINLPTFWNVSPTLRVEAV